MFFGLLQMLLGMIFLILRNEWSLRVISRSSYSKKFFKKMRTTRRFPMKKEYEQFLKELRTNFTNEAVVDFCVGAKRNPSVVYY